MFMLPLTPILILLSTYIATSKMSSDRKTQFFVVVAIIVVLIVLFGILFA